MVVVRVTHFDGTVRRHKFGKSFTIGGARCDVALAEFEATRELVAITIDEPDVTIARCDDATELNGWSIDLVFVHVVHVGDRLTCRGTAVVFELVSASPEEASTFLRESERGSHADEQALLDTLRADPTDDETRMVYADWLDSHGRTSEAELLRLLWIPDSQRVTDTAAFSSSWFSHQPRAVQLRLRDLAPVSEAGWRAIVAHVPLVCRKSECPAAWDRLKPTADDRARRCDRCNRDIRFCSQLAELREHGRRREPVAIDPILVPEAADAAYRSADDDAETYDIDD